MLTSLVSTLFAKQNDKGRYGDSHERERSNLHGTSIVAVKRIDPIALLLFV